MNILNGFTKEQQYTINDIVNNNLFELKEKKFYQLQKKWLLNQVFCENHLKFISLLVILYDLSKSNFEGIYSNEKAKTRKTVITNLVKAYLHDDRYDQPELVVNLLNYIFKNNYFDKNLIKLLEIKNSKKELDKYYSYNYVKSYLTRLNYTPIEKSVNIPNASLYSQNMAFPSVVEITWSNW